MLVEALIFRFGYSIRPCDYEEKKKDYEMAVQIDRIFCSRRLQTRK